MTNDYVYHAWVICHLLCWRPLVVSSSNDIQKLSFVTKQHTVTRTSWQRQQLSFFYILLTVHHVMILGKWLMSSTIFYVFIYIFNSLHVSSTSCSSSGETNCVNRTSGSCHSVLVAVSYARRNDLHKTRALTQSDSYQILYWHNLSLLMMSTMCSKHVES